MADHLEPAERHEGLAWVRAADVSREWNGIKYKRGLSGKNAGSRHLSMNVAVVPPGAVAFAHIHVDFEVMLYILEGRVRHEYGWISSSRSITRRAILSSSSQASRTRF